MRSSSALIVSEADWSLSFNSNILLVLSDNCYLMLWLSSAKLSAWADNTTGVMGFAFIASISYIALFLSESVYLYLRDMIS